MRLEVLPLEEGDADAYGEVCWSAFKDGIMAIFYPNGYTKAARDWAKERFLKAYAEDPHKNRFAKVIDHDLADSSPTLKIVGVTWWEFYTKPRTDAELDALEKEDENRPHAPDSNGECIEDFHRAVIKTKRQILGGQPHALCHILTVLPEYHRCGIGSLLMRWGLEQCDREGLQSYLEASPMGKGLYKKLGYEEVKDLDFDARKWGLGRDLPHVCMVRPAREVNGVS